MIFHVLTIFPDFFRAAFEQGVVGKARTAGLIEIRVHDLRSWTRDRHRTVDDRPFGGGEGMLLKAGPIFEAVESIWPERGAGKKVILLSAQGRKFDQARARLQKKLLSTKKRSRKAAGKRRDVNARPPSPRSRFEDLAELVPTRAVQCCEGRYRRRLVHGGVSAGRRRQVQNQPRWSGVLSSPCPLIASADGKMLSYIARASRTKRIRSSSDFGTNRITSPTWDSKIGVCRHFR